MLPLVVLGIPQYDVLLSWQLCNVAFPITKKLCKPLRLQTHLHAHVR